jgi:hypothetical protein
MSSDRQEPEAKTLAPGLSTAANSDAPVGIRYGRILRLQTILGQPRRPVVIPERHAAIGIHPGPRPPMALHPGPRIRRQIRGGDVDRLTALQRRQPLTGAVIGRRQARALASWVLGLRGPRGGWSSPPGPCTLSLAGESHNPSSANHSPWSTLSAIEPSGDTTARHHQ